LAARPALAPERAVHLFGTGHPITFAFAALFGVDLFDSAAYHKFARRDSLLFPEGTLALEDVREPFCGCRLCEALPLTTLSRLAPPEREAAVARHNLWMCATEVRRVRQAIREGTLWELVERRAAAHPALLAGVRAAVRGSGVFLPVEPESRPSFREVSESSRNRPAVVRFLEHLAQWRSTKGPFHLRAKVPLTPDYLGSIPAYGPDQAELFWAFPTEIGPVPLELSELYPVGAWVGPDEFDRPSGGSVPTVGAESEKAPEAGERWERVARWTDRQMSALLEWQYPGHTLPLGEGGLRGIRSRRTGRLREFAYEKQPAFRLGNDGLPRPTWIGAEMLHRAIQRPRLRVVVKDDAVPFVRVGRSLFSRFAGEADPEIVPGASVLLVDSSDRLLAVGRAELAAHEMGRLLRGTAVEVTAHARNPVPDAPGAGVDTSPAEH